jgi:molybdopterin-containing oxidoreductase family membrane subunit
MSSLKYESQLREPLVDGNKTYHDITEDICRPIEVKPGRLWYVGFFISIALLMFGIYSVYREVVYGVGQWNINHTVGWGWDITNFVWWIGIGHAGTLISAILLLFRQGWRTGVNRAAEAMTIFAVMCAGQFPIWHMGRVWMAFFTLPYPNTRGPVWPNFASASYVGRVRDLYILYRILAVSGIRVCCRISQLSATGQKPSCVNYYMESHHSDGAVQQNIGSVMNPFHSC